MDSLARVRTPLTLAILATLPFALGGCRVIGGIFKAGVGVGVVAVFFVIAIVVGIAALFGKSSRA
ncbi:MAG TPA: hypothetical protein VGG39_17405 [Polyangiaceae bacterium]|jgi:hypothetical protein